MRHLRIVPVVLLALGLGPALVACDKPSSPGGGNRAVAVPLLENFVGAWQRACRGYTDDITIQHEAEYTGRWVRINPTTAGSIEGSKTIIRFRLTMGGEPPQPQLIYDRVDGANPNQIILGSAVPVKLEGKGKDAAMVIGTGPTAVRLYHTVHPNC